MFTVAMLQGLSSKDFYRILTEPENSMVKQQVALLATEGVTLEFTDAAVKEVSRVAEEVNRSVDNIGARRLHTILERILEDISFNAPEIAAEAKANGTEAKRVIDLEDVQKSVGPLMTRTDLSKYVL
jgi:ATP-dependent HslUV protease ATP-binding subunit HslU